MWLSFWGTSMLPLQHGHVALISTTLLASLQPLALRYNLKQCVDFPTHIRHDGSLGSTLDLCFTNNVQAIRKVTSLPPLGQSEHTMVGCSIDFISGKKPTSSSKTPSKIMLIFRWLTRNSRPLIGLKSQQPPLLIVHDTDGSHCFSLLWTNTSLPNRLEPQKINPHGWTSLKITNQTKASGMERIQTNSLCGKPLKLSFNQE